MNGESYPKNIYSINEKILKKITLTSYEDVEKTVKAFVRQSALRLKAGHWLYDERPDEQYLSGHIGDFKVLEDVKASSLFVPFVEKHVFPSTSKIAVIGDIHGDIETLVTILEQLRKDEYLDENYAIIPDDFYIVFIGDYTNRMPYSVEVMKLLFHLYEQNIGSVFLLRGNHEYASCNKHFYDEFDYINNTREVGGIETLLGEFASKFDIYYYPDLLYWYDYLPLACYIGCKNEENGVTDFIQFCHAGLEIGFNPQQMLTSQDVRFQKISYLNRYNAVIKMLSSDKLASVHDRISFVFDYLSKTDLKDLAETYTNRGRIEFNDYKNMRDIKFGTQWNSFLTEANDSIDFAASIKHRNLQFGSKLTDYFLQHFSSSTAVIRSIVRGHQHLNDIDESMGLECNMLDNIIKGKGVSRQWDGKLYTLGDSGLVTNYQSYLIVSFANRREDWQVEHFFKKRKKDVFEKELLPMFG